MNKTIIKSKEPLVFVYEDIERVIAALANVEADDGDIFYIWLDVGYNEAVGWFPEHVLSRVSKCKYENGSWVISYGDSRQAVIRPLTEHDVTWPNYQAWQTYLKSTNNGDGSVSDESAIDFMSKFVEGKILSLATEGE